MTPKQEAAMRQALGVLRQCLDHPDADDAITALREALAEQAQKPTDADLLAARAYADQRWDGEDVPIEWLRHFVDGLGRQAAQQAAEPNAVLVEGFSQVALRKLNDLREKGYAVNGVSIATNTPDGKTEHGAVTTGGMVLWWPAQQAAEPVAWISEVRCVGPEYGKKRYGALPIQSLQPGYYAHTPLYASPRPSKPLTDEQITEGRRGAWGDVMDPFTAGVRFAEAAHGITGSKT